MNIRCLLVDDEHLALALLEQFVAQIPDLQILGKCKSAVHAAEIIQQEPVDLLFLDIQMPVLQLEYQYHLPTRDPYLHVFQKV